MNQSTNSLGSVVPLAMFWSEKSEANIISLKKGLVSWKMAEASARDWSGSRVFSLHQGSYCQEKNLTCECNEDFKSTLLVDFGIKVVTPKLIVIVQWIRKLYWNFFSQQCFSSRQLHCTDFLLFISSDDLGTRWGILKHMSTALICFNIRCQATLILDN